MSNIIKSFRVLQDSSKHKYIEKDVDQDIVDDTKELDFKKIKEEILKESQKESIRIITEAELKAEQIIIEAEESKKIMLLQLDAQSNEILKKAESEALIIKQDAKQTGYEHGFKEGKESGYSEGYGNGEADAQKLIGESLAIKEGYIKERESILKDLEPEIIKLVVDIYQKVLGQKIGEDEGVIVELVANGIKNLDPTEKLIIISSKEDYDTLGKYKERILAEASLINELEIKYDINLQKGDCILETPKGSIDLSIKEQMEEVEMLLHKILNNE